MYLPPTAMLHSSFSAVAACSAAKSDKSVAQHSKPRRVGGALQGITAKDGRALGQNILQFADKQTCPVRASLSGSAVAVLLCACSRLHLCRSRSGHLGVNGSIRTPKAMCDCSVFRRGSSHTLRNQILILVRGNINCVPLLYHLCACGADRIRTTLCTT